MKINLRLLCSFIATLGPVGRLPCSGTVASLLTVPFVYLLVHTQVPYIPCVVMLSFCALLIIQYALPLFNSADPSEVVLDEVVGCLWVLYMTQWNWFYCVVFLCLFRFFDITKILGIRFFERLPGSFGIVADDCAAAVYARFIAVLYWLFV